MKKEIFAIANDLIKCEAHCEGIVRDRGAGITPRGLIYEASNCNSKDGCIVIGENPGNAKNNEKSYFRNILAQKKTITYEDVEKCWIDDFSHWKYYSRIRDFITQVFGPINILWTDTVKCKKENNKESLNTNTIRKCVHLYLSRELSMCPSYWPILALGKHAFLLSSYICIERPVIGIYHPCAAHKDLFKPTYFDTDGILKFSCKSKILKLTQSSSMDAQFL